MTIFSRAFTLPYEWLRNSGGKRSLPSCIRNRGILFIHIPKNAGTSISHALYGLEVGDLHQLNYALQCLRARRLVEAGVRFVEITCPEVYGGDNGTWDQHSELKKGHEGNARITDQPIAGLIKDLASRGLLKETLIVWATEFGRTPHAPKPDCRDHHETAFTIWMAGGGIKGGLTYGATDEMGMKAVENVTEVHDLHATILHTLGLDHKKLTYRFGGREVSLTDVHGTLIRVLLS